MLWDDPSKAWRLLLNQNILMKRVCGYGQVPSESLLSLQGALRPTLLRSPFFSLCGSVPPSDWTKKTTLLVCQVQTTSREVAWPYLMSGLCPAPAGGAQRPPGAGPLYRWPLLVGFCALPELGWSQSLEISAVTSQPKLTEYHVLLCVSVCQAPAWVRMPMLWGTGSSEWNPTSSLWKSTPIC